MQLAEIRQSRTSPHFSRTITQKDHAWQACTSAARLPALRPHAFLHLTHALACTHISSWLARLLPQIKKGKSLPANNENKLHSGKYKTQKVLRMRSWVVPSGTQERIKSKQSFLFEEKIYFLYFTWGEKKRIKIFLYLYTSRPLWTSTHYSYYYYSSYCLCRQCIRRRYSVNYA
jgi:hypothetical protein